ncbi:hypothetical protein [Haladaptatus cibarius]|uniref:hypothetical protein n=1 Tax=Haladaptatus cibarius TaxID=453847 RepID=UPI000678929B|nr:hypothetical protein [Haladaptatus cibarius]
MSLSDPLELQQQILKAVKCLYPPNQFEVEPSVRDQLDLPETTGEYTIGDIDHVVPAAIEMKRIHGRYNALKMLYYNFKRMRDLGGSISAEVFLLMVEYCEIDDLAFDIDYVSGDVKPNNPAAAVIRGCAFFEQYLQNTIPWNDFIDHNDPSFAKLLNISTYDEVNFLTDIERRVGHLVRAIRNDVAHRSWLDMQYSYDAILLGVRAMTYLLEQQIRNYDAGGELSVPAEAENIDPQEAYLSKAENEFGWSYNSDRKYWETVNIEETPS